MILQQYSAQRHLDEDKLSIRRLTPLADALHSHDFLELVYVTKGYAIQQLGADTMRLSPGDFFILDFGAFHRYVETDNFEIINCLFAPEYMDRMLVNSPSLSSLLERRQLGAPFAHAHLANYIYHDDTGHILSLFEAMEQEYRQKAAGYQEIIRCHVIEALVHAARLAASAVTSAKMHPAAAAMAEYLQEHFALPLSLSSLSAYLGYTPQYLSALFHSETGMSLSAYLQRVRVEKSCRLLQETREPVSRIAQEVGYCDLKHFNAVFRRHTGLSPREYRARCAAAK
ncbi:MAG: helix-turn-helix domain-containing protein [Clostridiales bacterium]|nr:helix-turn-helix domain-containing protein [Clostridiales bacterium]